MGLRYVEKVVRRLLEKTDTPNRTALVRRALQIGLLHDEPLLERPVFEMRGTSGLPQLAGGGALPQLAGVLPTAGAAAPAASAPKLQAGKAGEAEEEAPAPAPAPREARRQSTSRQAVEKSSPPDTPPTKQIKQRKSIR